MALGEARRTRPEICSVLGSLPDKRAITYGYHFVRFRFLVGPETHKTRDGAKRSKSISLR